MPSEPTFVRRTCLFCGVTFWARRSDAKFDRSGCRQRAYRWRKNLARLQLKTADGIAGIAVYLAYDDSTPEAVRLLLTLRKQIDNQLERNNVKRAG